MCAGHVVGIGAVTPAAIATLMTSDATAFVKDLDSVAGQADIDLSADQGEGHGVEELLDLVMIVLPEPSKLPDGELIALDR